MVEGEVASRVTLRRAAYLATKLTSERKAAVAARAVLLASAGGGSGGGGGGGGGGNEKSYHLATSRSAAAGSSASSVTSRISDLDSRIAVLNKQLGTTIDVMVMLKSQVAPESLAEEGLGGKSTASGRSRRTARTGWMGLIGSLGIESAKRTVAWLAGTVTSLAARADAALVAVSTERASAVDTVTALEAALLEERAARRRLESGMRSHAAETAYLLTALTNAKAHNAAAVEASLWGLQETPHTKTATTTTTTAADATTPDTTTLVLAPTQRHPPKFQQAAITQEVLSLRRLLASATAQLHGALESNAAVEALKTALDVCREEVSTAKAEAAEAKARETLSREALLAELGKVKVKPTASGASGRNVSDSAVVDLVRDLAGGSAWGVTTLGAGAGSKGGGGGGRRVPRRDRRPSASASSTTGSQGGRPGGGGADCDDDGLVEEEEMGWDFEEELEGGEGEREDAAFANDEFEEGNGEEEEEEEEEERGGDEEEEYVEETVSHKPRRTGKSKGKAVEMTEGSAVSGKKTKGGGKKAAVAASTTITATKRISNGRKAQKISLGSTASSESTPPTADAVEDATVVGGGDGGVEVVQATPLEIIGGSVAVGKANKRGKKRKASELAQLPASASDLPILSTTSLEPPQITGLTKQQLLEVDPSSSSSSSSTSSSPPPLTASSPSLGPTPTHSAGPDPLPPPTCVCALPLLN